MICDYFRFKGNIDTIDCLCFGQTGSVYTQSSIVQSREERMIQEISKYKKGKSIEILRNHFQNHNS